MSRVTAPFIAALLAVTGSALAMLALYRAASSELDSILSAELRGAGESAAQCFSGSAPSPERLKALMRADALEGAFVVDRQMTVVADATGPSGHPVDLLRVDPDRLDQAMNGEVSTGPSYAVSGVKVASGYFPVRDAKGSVTGVLTLEAGEAFLHARRSLLHALALGCLLAVIAALALGFLAAGWGRTERHRQAAAAKAARGEIMSKMAAMAAHEIRNPLSVIRGTIELMNERMGSSLAARDRSALADVLGEVERLRRLTQDFLDLAAETPLMLTEVVLPELLEEAGRACEAAFPDIRVNRAIGRLPPIRGDACRLRQVISNLLTNAAQAQRQGDIELSAFEHSAREVLIRVRDHGPGIAPDLRGRLFDPLVTTKQGGTGLGLAVSRQIVERHGGTLTYVESPEPGAIFELRLPIGLATS